MKRLIAILLALTIFCGNLIAQENLDDGLVAYYPFNGNANDESGNGNNGTVNGPTLTTDRFGNENRAYSFDGVDDEIDIPHSESLNITGDITVCVWVNIDFNDHDHAVIDKRERQMYKINMNGDRPSFEMGYESAAHTTTQLNMGEWYFLVGRYKASSYERAIFVNGQLAGTNSSSNTVSSNTLSIKIGRRCQSDGYYFNGKIDDIRIYNRALSDDEIRQLTPVELTVFTATVGDGAVTLNWTTQTETENYGFHVYRSLFEDRDYVKITQSIIPGAGSSEVIHHYSYTDATVELSKTYYYKLASLDYNGNIEFHGPISVLVTDVKLIPTSKPPFVYSLAQNYPNPFNPQTTIKFALKEAGNVSLKIYNLQGQVVRTLVAAEKPVGSFSIIWNGMDDNGVQLASGVYYYTLKVNSFEETKKLTLMK